MRRVNHIMIGSGPTEDRDGGPMTMTDQETIELLVRLDERTERMEDDVSKLKHILIEGNGTPALTTQVARIDERLSAVEESKRDSTLSRRAWLGVLAAAVGGGGTIAILLQALLG